MLAAQPAKVLIIEDDDSIRESIRFILADEDYETLEAPNAIEGHAMLLAAGEPLVVLLDYRLPMMDGCDLLGIVAQDARLRDRHAFVMMSASPKQTSEDCGEELEDLSVPVLGKPFEIDELVDAVREAQLRLHPAA
jgi:two-component system response regulator RegX3